MTVDVSSSGSFKRRRLIGAVDHIASIDCTANIEESADEFYDFTPEDYYRIQRTRQKEDKFLKTQKIREAEDAERRSKITKAVIRVRFPDNRAVDATFHPSDKLQNLADYLRKVVARPELPFYSFTAPPKQVIRDMSQLCIFPTVHRTNVNQPYNARGHHCPCQEFYFPANNI